MSVYTSIYMRKYVYMCSLTLKSQALKKMVSSQSQKKEPEKKAAPKPPEQKTSHLSQAHLLAGAVKRRR